MVVELWKLSSITKKSLIMNKVVSFCFHWFIARTERQVWQIFSIFSRGPNYNYHNHEPINKFPLICTIISAGHSWLVPGDTVFCHELISWPMRVRYKWLLTNESEIWVATDQWERGMSGYWPIRDRPGGKIIHRDNIITGNWFSVMLLLLWLCGMSNSGEISHIRNQIINTSLINCAAMPVWWRNV